MLSTSNTSPINVVRIMGAGFTGLACAYFALHHPQTTCIEIYDKYLSDKNFTLMSHLSASNIPNNPSNKEQFDRFDTLASKLHSNVYKSIANTGCILNFPEK